MSIANNHPIVRDVINPTETLLLGEDHNTASLARITDAAAFYQVAPKLKAALEYTDQPGATVLDILTDNIQRLQDAFVDTLYSFFERNAVNLNHKLTLHLNENAMLTVSGDHPEKDRLNSLLPSCTDLATAFMELASQSSALRDLHNLQTMVMHNMASDRPVRLAAPGNDPAYQMSVKGEMNHFYFCVTPPRTR